VVGVSEYPYLTLPPVAELRPSIGLTLAGLADRAGVGVGNLEEAVQVLEEFHSGERPTRYRFAIEEEAVIVGQVEDESAGGWHTVVEMVS
jgi:hypothetical protein